MTESATAEAYYYAHTLTHRPLTPVSRYTAHPLLSIITTKLLNLPCEIRAHIYLLAFSKTRVAVTSCSGCYCAREASATGPYRDDHCWMLSLPKGGRLRAEVQRAFVRAAFWEVHCEKAFEGFVQVLKRLSCGRDTVGLLASVRHLKVNVFELSVQSWKVDTDVFGPGLKSVTFSPWQKGWTIDVHALEGEEEMGDEQVMEKVRKVIREKNGYGFVREALGWGKQERGGWDCYFLFPIRYQLEHQDGRRRWQLKVWRANLDEGVIERNWEDVHLVQEATLD